VYHTGKDLLKISEHSSGMKKIICSMNLYVSVVIMQSLKETLEDKVDNR